MTRKPKTVKSAAQPQAAEQNQGLTIEQALVLAQRHWNAGQAQQAEQLCQQVLAAWPGQADALHLLGLMAHAYGNLDLSVDYLRRACQSPSAPAVYLSNLAEICRQKGLLAEGEQAGRRAVALDAGLVAGWNNLGIILQEAGKLQESLTCLERVVALQPDYAEAHNNLGNTLKRLGRLDRVRVHYGKALALNPAYAEAHSNLASLLCELGEPAAALAESRRAIDLNPRLADAYINAAAAETAMGHHGEALRRLEALLSFAPAHVGALTARVNALKYFDRLDEALDSANRAVAAAPESGEAHNALGQVLQALGRADEALAAFDQAASLLALAPETALINKGVLLMEISRPKEALAAFDQALEINPQSASAWFNRADLKSFKADDPDIERMERLLAPDGVQGHDSRMSLHFALGKAYMDAGDSDRAFAHLAAGNRMKRASFHYDGDATDRWLAAIADHFPPALFERLQGAGDPSELPVFIIGIPRSGTTLVEQILAAHPQIHGAGELMAMQRMIDQVRGPDQQPVGYPQLAPALQPADLAGLARHYLGKVEPLAAGRRRVVDKMPSNFLYAGLIRLMLPNARIIHCRRNPVDTCLSCYTKLFTAEQNFAYDLTELGRFYRGYERLMDHWRSVLPADRFIEVQYEDVVEDMEAQARRLIDFCGLDWNKACLSFHKSRRPVRTASVNQVRKPIYRGSVGRWKPYAGHLGPLLAALGIEED